MELKQLRYFITVVQEGNISRAAEKLMISQPPLSTKLKELELELGVTLFVRGSRKIELTEAGILFFNRALSILELTDLSLKEQADYRDAKAGTLRIGIISSVSTTLAKSWIQSFHRQYPKIHLDLFEGNTYEQIDKLKNNLIELAIVRTPFSREQLECTTIKRENMAAIGLPVFFDGCAKNPLSLTNLSDKPLILYRRWEKTLLDAFHQTKQEPVIFCRCDDARTAISLADSGLGIGIVPESALSLSTNSGMKQYILSPNTLTSDICILRNPGSYLSTLAELFYRMITGSLT